MFDYLFNALLALFAVRDGAGIAASRFDQRAIRAMIDGDLAYWLGGSLHLTASGVEVFWAEFTGRFLPAAA